MQVVQHLQGTENILELVEEEDLCSKSLELLEADEDSPSTYVNDLNQHMEIVLGQSTDS